MWGLYLQHALDTENTDHVICPSTSLRHMVGHWPSFKSLAGPSKLKSTDVHDRPVLYPLPKALENVLGRTLYWRVCGELAGPSPVCRAGCAAPAGGVEIQLGLRLSGPTVLSRCSVHVCRADLQTMGLISLGYMLCLGLHLVLNRPFTASSSWNQKLERMGQALPACSL